MKKKNGIEVISELFCFKNISQILFLMSKHAYILMFCTVLKVLSYEK